MAMNDVVLDGCLLNVHCLASSFRRPTETNVQLEAERNPCSPVAVFLSFQLCCVGSMFPVAVLHFPRTSHPLRLLN